MILPIDVNASNLIKARIGNQFFDTLEEAILASTSKDTIILTNNISLNKTLDINKTVNINLNNYNIESDEKVFLVQGGSLNLSGNGKIIETKPNYGAIMVKGSSDPSKKDFSTISIGSGITLQGWSGIFINQENKTGYGILVNMNGKINAVNDTNGSPGAGIYVNGQIANIDNSPIINLSNTVKINSTGTGIYAAGYATYNINGAHIEGEESGLGIKSGVFNILNGTILGTGKDKTPTTGNNNGINPSGVAIQIESNPGYVGKIELYIKGGKIESQNSNVIYEYTVNDNPTQVKNINITGGTYISNSNKDVFLFSNNFNNVHKKFITGGKYSSNPSTYLDNGYTTFKSEDSLYEVITNTISTFNTTKEKSNKIFKYIIITFTLIILVIIGYLNRTRLSNFIKSLKTK